LPSGWSAVTLSGEIARSNGSVTGGAAVRDSGVLGRERELRDLPTTISNLEAALSQISTHRHQLEQQATGQATEERARQTELAGLAAQQRERGGQRTRLSTWLRDVVSQRDTADQQHASAGSSRTQRASELETIGHDISAAVTLRDTEREQHARIVASIAEQREAGSEEEARLSQAQQQLAGLEERVRAERRRASSLTAQRVALAEELGLRSQRMAELDGEQIAHKGQLTRLESEISGVQQSLDTATTERMPLAAQVEQAAVSRESTTGALERANQDLLVRERTLSQQELVVERSRAEHEAISVRIFEDLTVEDPVVLLELVLDAGDDDDAALTDPLVAEREISRLKERLRRVGYVGDDVVTEYEREAEHHLFLKTQLADVESATASLRQMLQDLHATMHAQFEETFAKVAAAFSTSFTTLFGGGTARLVLTTDEESENGKGGVDIVAQPPGKRLQNLSLLSGGERSLTGVALLFAILRVSPSPFVLLDEVDAALDEANVMRFREQLRVLASETQAIVITHNRGTVEIADTLYGISMGGDGISQTLSLRLSDMPPGDDMGVNVDTLTGVS
ncbi:MAG: AAA family ATPase, partial [Thermomicrobiales bacterium]